MTKNFVTIAILPTHNVQQFRQKLEKLSCAVQVEALEIKEVSKIQVPKQQVLKAIKQCDVPIADVKKTILVPIDFSEFTERTCEIGFRTATHLDTSLQLLYSICIPTLSFTAYSEEEILNQIVQSGKDIDNLADNVCEKIAQNLLPNVSFSYFLKEGLPEEEIIETATKIRPELVVMGTRGKNQKEYDLIGSVTAEVIEHCCVPVLAIPESVFAEKISFKNVLFATNFDDRTLISFDKMMNLIGKLSFKLFFTHFESRKDAWNEIKLSGIKHYFSLNYPNIETDYSIISDKSGDILVGFDNFVKEHDISLIVLNTHRRNLFAQLFNPSIARKMVFHARTPILVFHT